MAVAVPFSEDIVPQHFQLLRYFHFLILLHSRSLGEGNTDVLFKDEHPIGVYS